MICKECQNEYSSQGLPAHIKYSHDISTDEYAEKHGEFRKSKMNKLANSRDTSRVECGICNKTYSSVGMATHLKHAHGLTADEYVEDNPEYRKKHLNRSGANLTCLVCKETVHSERALTFHLKKQHNLTKKEYAVQSSMSTAENTQHANADAKKKQHSFTTIRISGNIFQVITQKEKATRCTGSLTRKRRKKKCLWLNTKA